MSAGEGKQGQEEDGQVADIEGCRVRERVDGFLCLGHLCVCFTIAVVGPSALVLHVTRSG